MTQPLEWTELDERAVATARVLAADAVHKTGNGHPGTANEPGASFHPPVSTGLCVTIRPTPVGLAVTGSSCPPGTPA